MSGVDFNDQDAAREYARRVGVEYRFGCFEEKRPESCHLLADYLEAVEQKPARARSIYETNCYSGKFPPSCYKFARYQLKKTSDGEPDHDKALDAFQRSCDGSFVEGCQWFAQLLKLGTPSHPPDPIKAIEVLAKNCEKGEYAESCWWVSSWLLAKNKTQMKNDGDLNKIEPNPTRAFYFASKGCDLHHFQSCVNLSLMLKNGEGCEKDEQKAEEILNKAKLIIEPVTDKYTISMTG